MPNVTSTRRSFLHRLGWLVLLWAMGVAALAAVAFPLRELMLAAGLKG